MKPARSTLSVPGHLEKMHHKAKGSQADVIMFDLEDSVPLDQKEAARIIIIHSILTLDWQDKTLAVRINGLETAFGFRDALQIADAAGSKLDFMVLPKVSHPGDIHFIDRLISGIEMEKSRERKLGIEASIETAMGLDQVSAIAGASSRMRSLSFGVADYTASVGAGLVSLSGHGDNEEDIYPGHRWHFPLSRMIMAAKARGLLAIDAPYGNFKDSYGLEKSAAMARALGCDGKWVIHPDQIPVVNQVFIPAKGEIVRAKRILRAMERTGSQSMGAVAVDGKMVDQATVRLARQIWDQACHLGLDNTTE